MSEYQFNPKRQVYGIDANNIEWVILEYPKETIGKGKKWVVYGSKDKKIVYNDKFSSKASALKTIQKRRKLPILVSGHKRGLPIPDRPVDYDRGDDYAIYDEYGHPKRAL